MIGNINKTKEILDRFDLRAKKGYGQNFLVDENILSKICSCASLDKEVGVIEIGPGLGSLTEHLLMNCKKVLAFEIDVDMVEVLNYTLKEYDNLKIINQDFLKVNLEDYLEYFKDCSCVKVVANLPYYITTAIITKLLEVDLGIKEYYFMVQKEVGDRLTSTPQTKDYNALSVLMAYKSISKIEFKVGRNCFYPAPEVDSVIISVKSNKIDLNINNEAKFLKFIQNMFIQRRKTIVNNLNTAYSINKDKIKEYLKECGIKETARSEELDIYQIGKLYRIIFE